MTTTYDLTEVLDRLEDIVEEFGPETKNYACINSTGDGVPVCIVGALLDDLGVSYDYEYQRQSSVAELTLDGLFYGLLDADTVDFLSHLQAKADGADNGKVAKPVPGFEGELARSKGIAWGPALEKTKQQWGLA